MARSPRRPRSFGNNADWATCVRNLVNGTGRANGARSRGARNLVCAPHRYGNGDDARLNDKIHGPLGIGP